jgi:Peptidase family M1 domain
MVNRPRSVISAVGLAVVALGLVTVVPEKPAAATSTQSTTCSNAASTRAAALDNRIKMAVQLEFDPKTAMVTGRVNATFTPDLPTDRVVLRLWPNGGQRDNTAPVSELSNVTINDVTATPKRINSTTVSIASGNLQAGRASSISYEFAVTAKGQRNDRISVTRSSSGQFVAARFGSFIPNIAWEDGVGWNLTPSTNGGAEASMHATADWDVTIRSDSEVLGSGTKIESIEGVHTFRSTAQRDWGMSIGTFRDAKKVVRVSDPTTRVQSEVAVTVGVSTALPKAESPDAYLKRVETAIRDQTARFGTYPWPTYTLAITPGLRGGIENPSFVMQGPGSIGRTTPHEVAHQWFYGLVGNDQGRDPWIDEGLATWAEARTEGALSAFVSKDIAAAGRNRVGSPMTYWDVNRSAYYRSVYVQTVKALSELGDPKEVDCALKTFVALNAYRVATPTNVLNALELSFPNARQVFSRYGVKG